MSSPYYVPGAALPPSVDWAYGNDAASRLYPFRAQPSYNGKTRLTGTACGGPNSLQVNRGTCTPLGGDRCANKYPDFWGASEFYQPFGVQYTDLPYGAGAGPCSPVRGCLDPLAYTYDKLADVHCQAMCRYRKPKICVADPPPAYGDDQCAPCVDETTGKTALQEMYAAKRGSKGRRAGRHIFETDCA